MANQKEDSKGQSPVMEEKFFPVLNLVKHDHLNDCSTEDCQPEHKSSSDAGDNFCTGCYKFIQSGSMNIPSQDYTPQASMLHQVTVKTRR